MRSIPVVYGSIISPYVRKVALTLNKKKISYDLKALNPFFEADKKFLATLNPLGKVPVYQEGNFTVCDSSVICAYLEKAFPEPAIFPKNPQEYARSLWFEEFADTQLFPALITLFFNQVLAPMLNKPSNQDAVTTTLEITLPTMFEYLNKEITNTNFLVGDRLSIADISIGQLAIINFDFLDIKIDLSRWERLATYINHIAENDLFRQAFLLSLERLKKITEKQN
jgi:glutathione S-transferase